MDPDERKQVYLGGWYMSECNLMQSLHLVILDVGQTAIVGLKSRRIQGCLV